MPVTEHFTPGVPEMNVLPGYQYGNKFMFTWPWWDNYVVDPVTMVGSSLSAPVGANGKTQYIGPQYLYEDRADNPGKSFNDNFR
jgi:hypothetical protein